VPDPAPSYDLRACGLGVVRELWAGVLRHIADDLDGQHDQHDVKGSSAKSMRYEIRKNWEAGVGVQETARDLWLTS
jgi:hypothetical protein